MEEQYKICIIIAGDTSLKDASDFKIEREKLPNQAVCKDAAATCYEEDNIEVSEEDAESSEEAQTEEIGTESRRFRRDRRPFEREEKPAPQPVAEPKPEKKSWWKKLIG